MAHNDRHRFALGMALLGLACVWSTTNLDLNLINLPASVVDKPLWLRLLVGVSLTAMFTAYVYWLDVWMHSPAFALLMLRRIDPLRCSATDAVRCSAWCTQEASKIIKRWCGHDHNGELGVEAFMHGLSEGLYTPLGFNVMPWTGLGICSHGAVRPSWTPDHLENASSLGFRVGKDIKRRFGELER